MKKIILSVILSVLLAGVCSAQENIVSYYYGSTSYPGIQEGEVFLRVISDNIVILPLSIVDQKTGIIHTLFEFKNDPFALSKNFDKIRYKTKRLGDTAYTISGEIIYFYRPVFISSEEFYSK